MNFFEQVKVGDCYRLGSHRFTAEEIVSFARRFDPQPFHVDEEAAKRSHFGALCASGWHTASIWMRLMVEFRKREAQMRRARGEAVATIGPSPGFTEMRWLKPVYAGDAISYQSDVTATRPSASRPDFGLVTLFNSGANQNNERVISFVSTAFVPKLP
jgi:acyl dehydratase